MWQKSSKAFSPSWKVLSTDILASGDFWTHFGLSLCQVQHHHNLLPPTSGSDWLSNHRFRRNNADPGWTWPWNSGPVLYPRRCAEGVMGVWPLSLHVFCELEEGLWSCPPSNLVACTATRALYNQSVSCVHIFGTDTFPMCLKPWTCQVCPSSLMWFVMFMDRISRRDKETSVSGMGTSGLHHCFLQSSKLPPAVVCYYVCFWGWNNFAHKYW